MKKQMNFPLDGRLTAAAKMVRHGARIADIGTDHAYIPVYLITSGVSPYAVAADINKGPLERARINAEKYGVADKIRFSLANGLDCLDSYDGADEKIDDIIICGMGGELIAEIISRSDYAQRAGVRLILQPMSSQEELRDFLARSGFSVIDEVLSAAAGRLYTTILAEYTGKLETYTDVERLIGKKCMEKREILFPRLVEENIKKLYVKIAGKKKGSQNTEYEEKLLRELEKLSEAEQ